MFNIYTDEKKKKKQELKNQVLKLKDKSSALYKKLNEKMNFNMRYGGKNGKSYFYSKSKRWSR